MDKLDILIIKLLKEINCDVGDLYALSKEEKKILYKDLKNKKKAKEDKNGN